MREQNITDSNTSSNDEQNEATSSSNSDEENVESALHDQLHQIEKKLKEIDQLELKRMNGDDLKSDEMIQLNRKHLLTQKFYELQQETDFAVDEWNNV